MDLIILIIIIASVLTRLKKNGADKKSIRKTYSERDIRKKAIERENQEKKEREERKKRDLEEQRKRELEEKRKYLEQKKKQEEKERKEKEEKEMLERFHVSEQSKNECSTCNEKAAMQKAEKEKFCIEYYLDPLTAPFYPGNMKKEKSDTFCVDDYLFPTLAPYYPQTGDVAANTYK